MCEYKNLIFSKYLIGIEQAFSFPYLQKAFVVILMHFSKLRNQIFISHQTFKNSILIVFQAKKVRVPEE